MGSSMVIMCSSRSLLILSSMAASVVDLPEPVGPVTRTNPRGLSQRPFTTVGSPSASNPLMSHRSEEHTSELQSRLHLVCRLLLEKKNKKKQNVNDSTPPSKLTFAHCSHDQPH